LSQVRFPSWISRFFGEEGIRWSIAGLTTQALTDLRPGFEKFAWNKLPLRIDNGGGIKTSPSQSRLPFMFSANFGR